MADRLIPEDERQRQSSARYWDDMAASFDDEPDHSLRDPVILSPAMIACAETKAAAAGQRVTLHVMDAALPALAPQQFDMIVCRHLLWALPDFPQVLRRWVELLKARGRLLLIEGCWRTGGLHAAEIVEALPPSLTNIAVQNLSTQSVYWGGEVIDERYAIIADLRQ